LIRAVLPTADNPAKSARARAKAGAELRDIVPDSHSAMDYLRDQTYV
jgi:hypothetical protein